MQTSEHFGELMFFCLDCEHSWSVQPGKLPPRVRTEAQSVSADDPLLTLREHRLRLARWTVTMAGRAAAARARAMHLAVEFKARREVHLYVRALIDRARAIKGSVH